MKKRFINLGIILCIDYGGLAFANMVKKKMGSEARKNP